MKRLLNIILKTILAISFFVVALFILSDFFIKNPYCLMHAYTDTFLDILYITAPLPILYFLFKEIKEAGIFSQEDVLYNIFLCITGLFLTFSLYHSGLYFFKLTDIISKDLVLISFSVLFLLIAVLLSFAFFKKAKKDSLTYITLFVPAILFVGRILNCIVRAEVSYMQPVEIFELISSAAFLTIAPIFLFYLFINKVKEEGLFSYENGFYDMSAIFTGLAIVIYIICCLYTDFTLKNVMSHSLLLFLMSFPVVFFYSLSEKVKNKTFFLKNNPAHNIIITITYIVFGILSCLVFLIGSQLFYKPINEILEVAYISFVGILQVAFFHLVLNFTDITKNILLKILSVLFSLFLACAFFLWIIFCILLSPSMYFG